MSLICSVKGFCECGLEVDLGTTAGKGYDHARASTALQGTCTREAHTPWGKLLSYWRKK